MEKNMTCKPKVSEDTFVVLAGFWCRLLEVHGSDGLAGPACQEEGFVIYCCVVCVCVCVCVRLCMCMCLCVVIGRAKGQRLYDLAGAGGVF